MGIVHGTIAARAQGSAAQSYHGQHDSVGFHATKPDLTTVAARLQEHRDNITFLHAFWYLDPRGGTLWLIVCRHRISKLHCHRTDRRFAVRLQRACRSHTVPDAGARTAPRDPVITQ